MPPDGFLENRRQPKRTQGQAASINAAMGNFRLPIAALALFVSELRDTPLLAHYG